VFIITAWQRISAEATVKSFKKCCIPNAVDGTDGDMLWNDSEEGGYGGSECEEDVGTDYEDGDGDTDL
jgi:hypothetical protein